MAYNALVTAVSFWHTIAQHSPSASHALLFQTDTALCSGGAGLGLGLRLGQPWPVSAFLGYDYVGAPWDPAAAFARGLRHPVGNGGLSLRSLWSMLAITSARAWDGRTPEDEWFSMAFQGNASRPSRDQDQAVGQDTDIDKDMDWQKSRRKMPTDPEWSPGIAAAGIEAIQSHVWEGSGLGTGKEASVEGSAPRGDDNGGGGLAPLDVAKRFAAENMSPFLDLPDHTTEANVAVDGETDLNMPFVPFGVHAPHRYWTGHRFRSLVGA